MTKEKTTENQESKESNLLQRPEIHPNLFWEAVGAREETILPR